VESIVLFFDTKLIKEKIISPLTRGIIGGRLGGAGVLN
jgi:hypothetical protein